MKIFRLWVMMMCLSIISTSLMAQCIKGNCWNGNGTYRFADGSSYVGDFKSGKYHGRGTYLFKDKTRYEGTFVAGRFEGKGIMYYTDGSYYVGEFFKNKKHGQGTMHYANGKKKAGSWSEGYYTADREVIIETDNTPPTRTSTPPTPTTTFAKDVKIWAVIVGVARYTAMPSLKFTDDDAYQFYAFLKSPEGGALPDNQIRVLIDEDATRQSILTNLKDILPKADANDVVMFYYSGHGLEGAFVPADFDGRNNLVSHEEVKALLDASPAKHKVCFVDACHSGSWAAMSANYSATLDKYYDAFEKTKGGTALFLSSKGEEVSLEDFGLRSGIFSHYLIKGLRGSADTNDDGIITILELYDFVSKNVTSYTARLQTPILNGTFDYNMPVGVVRM